MQTISSDWMHPDAKLENMFKFSNGHEVQVVAVDSIHALNQLVGYIKHKNKSCGEVFFRGQGTLHENLLPSLYREGKSNSSVGSRNEKISKYINACSTKMEIIENLDKNVREPLLQHYGIKTRWLDLVDNLWIALWFSIHKYKSKTSDRTYEYVYPRNDNEGHAYLMLVFSDANVKKPESPGYYRGTTTDLVDLRIATPSVFLRPHAQHAILIKPRQMQTIADVDMSKNVCLIIKIKVSNIKDWLGTGRLVAAENIYPPPFYDNGYSLLLEQAPHEKDDINNFGSITSISFSSALIK